MDYLDAVGIIGWIVFHYWQLSSSPSGRGWYNRGKVQIQCAPPGYLFGLVWFVLYGLLTASAILFFKNTIDYDAVFILWVINIMLNKLWSVLFFDMGRTGSSLVVAIAMLGTQIAVIVLIAIDGLSVVDRWFPFATYIVYTLWLFVAIYLNAQWVIKKLPTNNKR